MCASGFIIIHCTKRYIVLVETQRDPRVTVTQMCRKWKIQANTKTGKTARQTILWISGVK